MNKQRPIAAKYSQLHAGLVSTAVSLLIVAIAIPIAVVAFNQDSTVTQRGSETISIDHTITKNQAP